MAESPEHEFLKHAINNVLLDFSRLKLYTFSETDRKLFDFSSLLERDWKRPVVGQVLWRHTEGVEKDLRTLAHDTDAEIKVYVARDTVKHRRAFAEIITDYRRSGRFEDLYKLKPIWVPADFDADQEADHAIVSDHLRNVVVSDILFNVVFGNISEQDVQRVLDASGIGGLQLAILYTIAHKGFINISWLSKDLAVSPGPVREKLLLLSGAGMIQAPRQAIAYEVTPRGRVFLDLVKRVHAAQRKKQMDPELRFILTKLGCDPVPWADVARLFGDVTVPPFVELVRTISEASQWIDPSK